MQPRSRYPSPRLASPSWPLPPAAEVVERVVARVNGDIVTLSEFEARQVAEVQARRVIAPERIEAFLRDNNARILQEAIDELLILQRGEELGIRLRPEYVQEVIEGIKKENNITDDGRAAPPAPPGGHDPRGPEAQHRALHRAAPGPVPGAGGADGGHGRRGPGGLRGPEGRLHARAPPYPPGDRGQGRSALARDLASPRPGGRGLRGPGPRALRRRPARRRGRPGPAQPGRHEPADGGGGLRPASGRESRSPSAPTRASASSRWSRRRKAPWSPSRR